MLPTKLASAAFLGTRSVRPPEAVVVLMRSPGVPAAGSVLPGAAGRSPVRSAVLRLPVLGDCLSCTRRPGSPNDRWSDSREADRLSPYVPTGYVPDGEVTTVT